MLYFHPIFQFVLILLSWYVLYLGFQRFKSLHLGREATFLRPRHILLGKIALAGMMLGAAGGVFITKNTWNHNFVEPDHSYGALIMMALMTWGIVSGLYLQFSPSKRTVLPLLHGLGNALVALLGLWQIATGWDFLEDWVWASL